MPRLLGETCKVQEAKQKAYYDNQQKRPELRARGLAPPYSAPQPSYPLGGWRRAHTMQYTMHRIAVTKAAGLRRLAHPDKAQDRKRITTKAGTLSRPGSVELLFRPSYSAGTTSLGWVT